MKNFDRQYRLSAGKAGGTGFEIGEPAGPQNMPLHISFGIERTDLESQNTATVTVWNLSPAHIQALNEEDCVVVLKAGYGSTMPLIFTGVVTRVETQLDGADMATEIELVDTRVELRDTYVSLSYTGTINAKKVIEDTAGQMGVTVSYSYNAEAELVDIPNGYSYIGQAKNVLSKMCDCCGLSWSIQNGVLQIKKPGDTMLREVFLLSPDTGLVGIPKKITVSKEDSSKKGESGWEVEYLMNAAINIDDYVRLESKHVTGYFRVSKVKIEGDNFGSNWTCVAELLEVE